MYTANKIAISVTSLDKPGQYLSFRLKKDLENEMSEHRDYTRMFVVSDIEGNFKSFRNLLIKSGVIDKQYRWTFGDNRLVIVGDCFDRGEEVSECLWMIYLLEEKARKEGGYVHFILGNHEIMNMNGDWRYMHPKYAVRKNGDATAIYEGNYQLWRWLCTKNIIEKIGDILFVHGGIANELIQLNLSVKEINELARPFYTKSSQVFANPVLSLLFHHNTSPFWHRGYYLGTCSEEEIDMTLAHFKVSAIVTGHTLIGKVDGFFNNKVFNVNTDHSSGNSEGLLIRKGKFYRMPLKGKKEKIK